MSIHLAVPQKSITKPMRDALAFYAGMSLFFLVLLVLQ